MRSVKLTEYIDTVARLHPQAADVMRRLCGTGSLTPVFDSYAGDGYFLTNDAYGTNRRDMYFAKIGLDGTEIARYVTGDTVRCLQIVQDGRAVLLALDTTYLLLDATTLGKIHAYTKKVPRYSDQIHLDTDTIYSVNRTQNKLRIYDTARETARSITLPGVPAVTYTDTYNPATAPCPVMRADGRRLMIATSNPHRTLLFNMDLQRFEA